ncbi:hypothetical protein PghCCS26_62660 [Paenibacillus glycanilyticus]|uniref:Phage-Barnase-EndoU-ColicinE5/D-RelE like nuclease 3 domain-containing protein n=1 Tax=Paenibacillus glycanilyticus TaxID=126569 RepID=A0ABQ6NVP4_9BACL|nr:PBECR2 nuclease fold domain-containing protein [Paenibacillus glycanilyticus]GMK49136.1 hypothetical protein PghCCS26_62660 [Paenibacillus glycanilyticus]
MSSQIGTIKPREITLLKLSIAPGTPIYCGEPNIQHMKDEHPEDYAKYGHLLADIIQSPDYVATHKNGAIQYIKEFTEQNSKDKVLVAVRATGRGTYFSRTLFVMSEEKWDKYCDGGHVMEYKVKPKKYPK